MNELNGGIRSTVLLPPTISLFLLTVCFAMECQSFLFKQRQAHPLDVNQCCAPKVKLYGVKPFLFLLFVGNNYTYVDFYSIAAALSDLESYFVLAAVISYSFDRVAKYVLVPIRITWTTRITWTALPDIHLFAAGPFNSSVC
jgi:hypothetical protein